MSCFELAMFSKTSEMVATSKHIYSIIYLQLDIFTITGCLVFLSFSQAILMGMTVMYKLNTNTCNCTCGGLRHRLEIVHGKSFTLVYNNSYTTARHRDHHQSSEAGQRYVERSYSFITYFESSTCKYSSMH